VGSSRLFGDDTTERQRVRWKMKYKKMKYKKMKYKKIRLYRLYRVGGIEVAMGERESNL
jgi:hypothetical protein